MAYQFGNTDVVFIFPVAAYMGLLFLFSLDRMKKPQAAILILGTLIAVVYLVYEGLLIQEVDWVGNSTIVASGFIGGIVLGGGRKLYKEDWPHEFRNAPNFILLILGIVLIAGLIELHLINESPISASPTGLTVDFSVQWLQLQFVDLIPHLAFTGLYLFIVDKFTTYDYQQQFMVLGPKRGGKTTMMTGAFHTADQFSEGNASASENLLENITTLLNSKQGFGNIDEPTPAGDYFTLWFEYDFGEWLKKNVQVEAIDHGGEVLMDLKNEIDKVADESLWDNRPKPIKRFIEIMKEIRLGLGSEDTRDRKIEAITGETSEFRTEAHEAVARSVVDADSLVLTIPLIDYVDEVVSEENLPEYYDKSDPESSKRPNRVAYLAEYDKILNWFTDQGKSEVIIVTTMSDLLLKEFEERKLNGAEATTEEEHRRYERWIKNDVMGADIDRLLEYSSNDTPLALYFKMNPEPEIVDGEKKPNPVLEDGSVKFVNGDRLLKRLAS